MIKKATFILLFLLCQLHNVFAQFAFQRIYGGPDHDRAQTIFNTYDNGLIVSGASFSWGVGDVDALLFKLDNQGQILWGYTYGTPGYDNLEYAIETFDHNIVCSGRSNLAGNNTSATIFKTDSAGQLLWSKSFGGSSNAGLTEIIESSDHGYAAVGLVKDISTNQSDILFVRTDINGDTLFTRIYGSPLSEDGLSVIQLPDSGFIIGGRQIDNSSGIPKSDGLLLRTDAGGNLLWANLYGDSLWEELTAVRFTSDSGLIVGGSTVTFGAGSYDVLLMKTDNSGNVQWAETFGGALTDAAYDVHITSDNSYVLSGYTESLGYGHRGADSTNVFLLKTDANGIFRWMEVYGDGLQDEAYRSNKTNDGGFAVAGFTTNYFPSDSSQMFVVKTDSMGISGCHEESVQPIDSMITMPYHTISLNQSSGISFSAFSFTRIPFSPSSDDACSFASVNSINVRPNGINAFPNPFTDHLEIVLNGQISLNDEVIISDVFGKKIKSFRIKSYQINMETGDLEQGIYILSVVGKETSDKGILLIKN